MWEHGNAAFHVQDYRQRHHLTYPLLLDEGERYATQFELQGVPTNVLVDPYGRIVDVGGTTPDELQRLIKRAIMRYEVDVHPSGSR